MSDFKDHFIRNLDRLDPMELLKPETWGRVYRETREQLATQADQLRTEQKERGE